MVVKYSLYSISICDTVTKVIPLCSVYQADEKLYITNYGIVEDEKVYVTNHGIVDDEKLYITNYGIVEDENFISQTMVLW